MSSRLTLREDLRTDERVLVGVRELLVVEVMEQAGHAPPDRIFVRGELARAGLHGLLDGKRMLAQRIRLGELVEEGESFVAGLHGSAVYARHPGDAQSRRRLPGPQ